MALLTNVKNCSIALNKKNKPVTQTKALKGFLFINRKVHLVAKHKNKQPKQPRPIVESTKVEIQPKPSKLKRILNRGKLPSPVRYILKLMLASMYVVLLIQGVISMLDYVTQTGMIKIASVTETTSRSILASQLNQYLNLTTYVGAILIAVSIIVLVWKLIIKPIRKRYSTFVEWLNK